ncbi:hypothetical protein [Rickettsia canadensis]|uniref:hypothetical protein n=1 Tax=Rickettsia canadensis TaxID=788 RepID=UPI0000DADBB9|nr:hypothetical protein [Rickettsia canadensis]
MLHLKIKGIVGLKDVKVKPQLHGFVNYDFRGKLSNTNAQLDGIDELLTTVRFKPVKLNYNLGESFSTKNDMIEFGVRYIMYPLQNNI